MNRSSLGVAAQMLLSNPLRTILSTLGIIMGVAALVAVLAIGDGIEKYARGQIESTTDLQTIVVGPILYDKIDGAPIPRRDFPLFTLSDADSLARRLAGSASVAPTIQGGTRVTMPNGEVRLAQLAATSAAYRERQIPAPVAGRFFDDAELRGSQHVVVVSNALGKAMAGARPLPQLIGDSVRLEGNVFRIVGVLGGADGNEHTLAALIPFTTASLALAPSTIPQAPHLLVRAHRLEQVNDVRLRSEQWLTARFGDWRNIAKAEHSRGLRMKQAQQAMLIFKLAMGAFAGITLIVGGIGIMNVLLASVIERTREIGVRKALGARRREILQQFITEAIVICAVGAAIGVVLGLAGAFGVTAILRTASAASIHAAFTWTSLLAAASASIIIGGVFGAYPALRAARLSPIEAIRHE